MREEMRDGMRDDVRDGTANGYSRRFAMLRPVRRGMDGMAGFARIEARGSLVTVNISVQGVGEDGGQTWLLGGDNGALRVSCGALSLGRRGQGGAYAEFRAGDVGGARLADYHTVAVIACDEHGGCVPLLAGVFGSQGIRDWDALCAEIAAGEAPAVREPADEQPARQDDPSADAPDTEPTPEQAEAEAEAALPEAAVVSIAAADECGGEEPPAEGQGEDTPESAPNEEKPVESEEGAPQEALGEPGAEPEKAIEDTGGEQPAAMGDWDDIRWLGHAASLRTLFARSEVCTPIEGMSATRFVRVPMAVPVAGIDGYILGVHTTAGEADALCIGVAGAGDARPAGLEGAQWRAGSDGGGWWLTWQDAFTGYPAPPAE